MIFAACSGSGHSATGTSGGRIAAGPRAASGHTAGGGKAVPVPATIDATGRTDVTKQLQHLISTTADDSTITFRANGRYRVDGTLLVGRRHDLTFDGAGALVFATTRGGPERAQFWVRDGSHITFRNIRIQGANKKAGTGKHAYVPKLAKQHGIRLDGVDGAEVDHVTITKPFGDFIYIGLDKQQRGSQNVWIHDSTFRANGRQGVAVTAASGVVIEHNSFDDTRRSTIDLEPTGHSWHVDHVFILDNAVGTGRLLFVASHGLGPVDDVVIAGNRLHDHSLTIDAVPPGHHRRTNWIIRDNTSDMTVHSRPLRFSAIDGLEVSANVQRVAGGKPALEMTNVCGAQIAGNVFGDGAIRSTGKRCSAALVVPAQPPIRGRTDSNDLPGSGAHHDSAVWTWTVVGVSAAALLIVGASVFRRRRKRSPVGADL